MTLYELTGEYLALMEMAEDEDVDAQAFADTLEALNGEIEDKANGYARVIRSLKGEIEAVKTEIARLARKKRTLENRVDALMSGFENSMRAMGKAKVQTPLFCFSLQKNPPSVVIDEKDAIPDRFLTYSDPQPDKEAIKKFLKENDASWAHLAQSESLRLR